jgi:hypothetical protein
MRRSWIVLLIAAPLMAGHGPSVSLTTEEAKEIVVQGAFKGDRSYSLTATKGSYEPSFYDVEAAWDNPRGSMIAGHFAVNAETGTLWNLEGSVCNVITNGRLDRFRRALHDKLKTDQRVSARLTSLHPLECSVIGPVRGGLVR